MTETRPVEALTRGDLVLTAPESFPDNVAAGRLVRIVDVWHDEDDGWILTGLTEDGDLATAMEIKAGTPYEVRPEDSAPASLRGDWEQRVLAARSAHQAAFVRGSILSTIFQLLIGGVLAAAGLATGHLIPLILGTVFFLLGILKAYFSFRIAMTMPRGELDPS